MMGISIEIRRLFGHLLFKAKNILSKKKDIFRYDVASNQPKVECLERYFGFLEMGKRKDPSLEPDH
jgi:hypothetical protein